MYLLFSNAKTRKCLISFERKGMYCVKDAIAPHIRRNRENHYWEIIECTFS